MFIAKPTPLLLELITEKPSEEIPDERQWQNVLSTTLCLSIP